MLSEQPEAAHAAGIYLAQNLLLAAGYARGQGAIGWAGSTVGGCSCVALCEYIVGAPLEQAPHRHHSGILVVPVRPRAAAPACCTGPRAACRGLCRAATQVKHLLRRSA